MWALPLRAVLATVLSGRASVTATLNLGLFGLADRIGGLCRLNRA
ncbi:MAG: hypothetical protein QN152_00575 [Armatimonadota bacterium]|nr:hypothetical protein [Armatimonadota bacterium]MDR7426252.1 hypothetical protein [Armatimonadota bacterium]MDR7463293.1 hypothetical protein [Armatimonadota bacterium]MDR7474018.1 hypothetical protein [Armatimonadota bacterium]MDR7538012.1 hypothetical protein [Armatimonadota bacterium]